MKPNLFSYATSELSQDAMLCWIAAWADPASVVYNPHLHRHGMIFLKKIFKKHSKELPEIEKPIEIRKQYKGIDVLLVINSTIAVCIEDKVGTTEHSNQLERYKNSLKKDGFSIDNILPVYIQTVDQGNYNNVINAGYAIIRRSEMIAMFRSYLDDGGLDSIAQDYYDYLIEIEKQIESFCRLPTKEWKWHSWMGFYTKLQELLGYGEWGYVANPSGGFLGFWWHSHKDEESKQYLQLEQNNLCFKISVDESTKRKDLRKKWMIRILEAGRRYKLSIIKPKRLGKGQTMTVAVFNGEFRSTDDEGILDLDSTTRILRKAEDVLKRAINNGA